MTRRINPMTVVLWLGLGLLVVAFLAGGNAVARYIGLGTRTQTPDQLSALLQPHYRTHLPDGPGPWPTALLFSGCDGPKDNMDRWAAALVDAGWGAVIVDSHAPRGYADAQIWRLICAGQLLPGAERAGDVAVAIDDARALPSVDPDRIALIGASHGGWSILDMLSLHGRGKLPHNLSHWPASLRDNGLAGVAGVVLLYPYCGRGTQVSRHGWGDDVPALFLLVEDDSITDEDACLGLVERMRLQGMLVQSHVFRGTTHGFDQESKNAFSSLEFSPGATAEAERLVRNFLARIAD